MSASLIAGHSLALSGGGYRATLFQIGAIMRFNEVGLLRKLRCLSSVSGGSITSAYLGMIWDTLNFKNEVASNLGDLFVLPLREFCSKNLDVGAVLSGLANPFKHASEELADAYDEHLFHGKTLQDFPDSSDERAPEFTINATNLQTGICFRFSRAHVGDYRLGYADNPTISIAQAVTASSAFPPFFAPHEIDLSNYEFKPAGSKSDLNGRLDLRHVSLCDGGVYDNMGLEGVWNSYDTLWISDAGAPLNVEPSIPRDWLRLMMRVVDLLMRNSLAQRRHDLVALYQPVPGLKETQRKGTYWGITTAIGDYGLQDCLKCDHQKTERLASLGTRLNAFDEQDQCELINFGYALADAGLRKYALLTNPQRPTWPYRNFALD